MQWLRNRNALAVIVILILVIAVAVIGMTMRTSATTEPSDAEASGDLLYLLVTAGSITYEPIPLYGESAFTLTQSEDKVNVIHATHDSIWMESSTCENQNCVEQGMVTAENRNSRVLGNMIICLPNRVQLELFTADELREIGIMIADSQ